MTEEEPLKYQSLLAIRARKMQLNKEIQRSEQEIKTTWNTLFHEEGSDSKHSYPAIPIIGLIKRGTY